MYQQDVKDPKTTFDNQGYTKQAFDDKYYKEEFASMKMSFNMAKIGKQNKLDVLKVNSSDNQSGYDIEFRDEECANIKDVLTMLQNKDMDLVLMVDSCCVKKDNRNYTIMPKLRILQIVLRSNDS